MCQNAGVLRILTCKSASRHSGVPSFDIWTSKSSPILAVFFNILTFTCASRRSGVSFLAIWTSKSGPKLRFDLQMCFATQRRAMFVHLNFKKYVCDRQFSSILSYNSASRHSGVPFLDISTSISGPELLCFVHFDWKMCSGHSGVAIFSSLLNCYLRARPFSEPTFRTSGTKNHWENTARRDFPHLYSAFQLSKLSEVILLNFLRQYRYT